VTRNLSGMGDSVQSRLDSHLKTVLVSFCRPIYLQAFRDLLVLSHSFRTRDFNGVGRITSLNFQKVRIGWYFSLLI
jgi:hypothetical protein